MKLPTFPRKEPALCELGPWAPAGTNPAGRPAVELPLSPVLPLPLLLARLASVALLSVSSRLPLPLLGVLAPALGALVGVLVVV